MCIIIDHKTNRFSLKRYLVIAFITAHDLFSYMVLGNLLTTHIYTVPYMISKYKTFPT